MTRRTPPNKPLSSVLTTPCRTSGRISPPPSSSPKPPRSKPGRNSLAKLQLAPCLRGRAGLVLRRPLVGCLHTRARFVHSTLGVVVGLHRQPILVHRAVALAGDVEDVAQMDVAPDLGPARVAIAAQRVAEAVCRGLVIALCEENFADAIRCQRAGLVGVQRLLVLAQCAGVVALRIQLPPAQRTIG